MSFPRWLGSDASHRSVHNEQGTIQQVRRPTLDYGSLKLDSFIVNSFSGACGVNLALRPFAFSLILDLGRFKTRNIAYLFAIQWYSIRIPAEDPPSPLLWTFAHPLNPLLYPAIFVQDGSHGWPRVLWLMDLSLVLLW